MGIFEYNQSRYQFFNKLLMFKINNIVVESNLYKETMRNKDRTGWISFKEELPPLNLEVIILFPNVAYGGVLTGALGKRIDELTIQVSKGKLKLSVFEDYEHIMVKPFATYWAFNFSYSEGISSSYAQELVADIDRLNQIELHKIK